MTTGGSSYELTRSQVAAIEEFSSFLTGPEQALILTGSAGSGKTFVLSQFAQVLKERHAPYLMLAPTGRSARVLSTRLRDSASTIHSAIYALDSLEVDVPTTAGVRYRFGLRDSNKLDAAVIVVDEASMVGDVTSDGEILQFGSGRLLSDLLTYCFSGHPQSSRRKVVFVGDPCQLPPVGEAHSPALDVAYLIEAHQLSVRSSRLDEVVRQRAGSGVLELAGHVRAGLERHSFERLRLTREFSDVAQLEAGQLHSVFADVLRQAGEENAILLTRSNAAALHDNRIIRERKHGDADRSPQPGDRIVVVQNCVRTGLMNGQFGTIRQAAPDTELRVARDVELEFRDAVIEMEEPSGATVTFDVKLWEPLLASREPTLTPAEIGALYADFIVRHPNLSRRSEEFSRTFRSDPYVNALRVKYGWAVTCHKAQGGEWSDVFVAFEHALTNEEAFRWVYTALTRASARLYLVDAPNFGPGTDAAEQLGYTMNALRELPDRIAGLLAETDLQLAGLSALANGLRCEIVRGDMLVAIDVFTKSSGQVSAIRPTRPGQDEQVLRAAIDALKVLQVPESSAVPEKLPESVSTFLRLVQTRLHEAEGHVLSIVYRSYQVQVNVQVGEGPPHRITVHYKASGKISSVAAPPGVASAAVEIMKRCLEEL